MEIKGKVGDQHLTAEGLSSLRIKVEGQDQPTILNAPAKVIKALNATPGEDVTITIKTESSKK